MRPAVLIFANAYRRTVSILIRRRIHVLLSFFQPLLWMFFFGAVFTQTAESSGFIPSYTDFLIPGIGLMTCLTTGGQSGIGLIRDIQSGFLQRTVRASRRTFSLFLGRIAADLSRTWIQSLLVMLLGMLLLSPQQLSVTNVVLISFLFLPFSLMYLLISDAIALRTRRQENMAVFVNLVNLPLIFTSSLFVSGKQFPDWLEPIASHNPLSSFLALARSMNLGSEVRMFDQVMFGFALLLSVILLRICLHWLRALTAEDS